MERRLLLICNFVLLLGLIVGLGDQYIIKSNRESGKGRYDLMLAPKKNTVNRVGIIMELKVAKESEEIAAVAAQALQQIDSQKYIIELQNFSIDKTIKLGIAFFGTELECSYNIS
ncbi:MAG: hypothetical protein COB50_03585 [Thiotrichales bacterium]|nr:MAG: hypothetical protein COB50_03585 [Thiotrichales bacterium]